MQIIWTYLFCKREFISKVVFSTLYGYISLPLQFYGTNYRAGPQTSLFIQSTYSFDFTLGDLSFKRSREDIKFQNRETTFPFFLNIL